MDKNVIIKNKLVKIKEYKAKNNPIVINSLKRDLKEKMGKLKKNLNNSFDRYSSQSSSYYYTTGYLDIILDCYDKLLENKNNQELQWIFDKYKNLTIPQSEVNNERGILFREIIEIKDNIHYLEKELETIIELETAFQAYEEEKDRERESFEIALSNAEEWHQRDLEAKVEQKLKEREQSAQIEVPSK